MSAARYVDEVRPVQALAAQRPANKKGLGALWLTRPMEDLDELGISAVTVNVMLNAVLSTEKGGWPE